MLELVLEEATCTTSEHSHPSDCQITKKAQAGSNIFLAFTQLPKAQLNSKAAVWLPMTELCTHAHLHTHTHCGELVKLSCMCQSSQERTELPWPVWLIAWASPCKPKGRQFNSRSGHMPGLWVQSPVWACMRGSLSMFLSLFLSLFHSLKTNK